MHPLKHLEDNLCDDIKPYSVTEGYMHLCTTSKVPIFQMIYRTVISHLKWHYSIGAFHRNVMQYKQDSPPKVTLYMSRPFRSELVNSPKVTVLFEKKTMLAQEMTRNFRLNSGKLILMFKHIRKFTFNHLL